MATCVLISELKDAISLDELAAISPTPITVTKNGCNRFVYIRSDEFEHIKHTNAEAKLLARMKIMDYECKNNLAEDAFKASERIMNKYGL